MLSRHQEGGGGAFVFCFMLGSAFVMWQTRLPLSLAQGLAWVALTTALLGWMDDRYQLSSALRFTLQVLISLLALLMMGFHHESLYGMSIGLHLFLGVVYLVGMINLFNFMDGINGYAVMEALFLSAVLCMEVLFPSTGIQSIMACLSVVMLGFGFWNFPVAKIFMGDVGSAFLGGVLGFVSLFIAMHQPDMIAPWFILIALYLSDAGLTLLMRVYRRERFWLAHRQHAYQHLTNLWGSHVYVTMGGAMINLFLLLPLAWLTSQKMLPDIIGLIMAYVPLILLAGYLGAGRLPKSA